MLTDPRITALAKSLTQHPPSLRAGAPFVIRAMPVAAPLVEECYRRALLPGARPHVDLRLPGPDGIYYRAASDRSPRAGSSDRTRPRRDLLSHRQRQRAARGGGDLRRWRVVRQGWAVR